MENQGLCQKIDNDSGIGIVKRGCGSYIIVGSYTITDQKAVMQYIQNNKEKIKSQNLMIGGTFYEISPPIRSNIPFQRGFRTFDADGFFIEYEKIKNQKRKKVRGSFFLDDTYKKPEKTENTKLIEIEQYKRKEVSKNGNEMCGLW